MFEKALNICIIGVGNVGTHLSQMLLPYSKSLFLCSQDANIETLCNKLDAKFCSKISDIPDNYDLYFICKQDKTVEKTALSLPDLKGAVIHTSGTLSINCLSKFPRHGVFYPFQSFKKNLPLQNTDFPIFIEANNTSDKYLLECLAKNFSSNIVLSTIDIRRKVHLAGVFASNFANYIFDKAYRILPPEIDPHKILLPLIDETVSRLVSGYPMDFQTGPAIRNDKEIMDEHLSMLDNSSDKKLYESISALIMKDSAK